MKLTKTRTLESQRKCRHGFELKRSFVLLAAGYASFCAPVQAQAPVGERQLVALEEVVVTARRREELLQDIPLAVTALSSEFLRDQNITRVEDLGIHVPSLRISSGGTGTNSPLITLRGQRPSTVTITEDPAVPIYFAEVVLTPTQGTNLAMYDLANVQVLKGPQGTLFGRNSTGGALLFTPTRPGEELGGYLETRLGNYDLVHVEGAVDLPASDTLRFRVAGISIDRDGYQDNVADNSLRGNEQFWDEDSYGMRVSMDWTPNDRLNNYTTLAYDENDMHNPVPVPLAFNSDAGLGRLTNAVFNGGAARIGGGVPSEPEVDEALARQKGRNWNEIETDVNGKDKVENLFLANTTEFELNDSLTLKNIFGYRDLDQKSSTDADGTAIPIFGAITSRTLPVTTNPRAGEVTATQYSDELQLLGDAFDDKMDWIAGVYWMSMDGSQTLPTQVLGANPAWPTGPSPIPIPDVNQLWYIAQNGFLQDSPNGDAENETYAIFGEANYMFNEQWSVTGGLRQTWDDRKMEVKNFSLDPNTLVYGCSVKDENNQLLPDNACSRKVDESFDKLTYRGSVNWNPMEDMLVYASVATGYRSGGFNLRGVNNFSLQPFDPETVITYELGHKTDWAVGNLASVRTNLAIYAQEFDDIQKTLSGTNPDTGAFETYTANAAKADINGLEFDVTVAPIESLVLALAYSYVDASYNEWERVVSENGTVSTVDFSGAPFVYIPKNTATASINYTLPLDASIGEVSFTASAYWQDDMDTNDSAFRWAGLGWSDANLQEALDTVEAEDYVVAHFRVDWGYVMGSNFDVAAFINNAFDEEYVTGGLSVPDSLGWVAASYGAPRTYGASLRYRF
jgi:iron complex outermembrane receptor protein